MEIEIKEKENEVKRVCFSLGQDFFFLELLFVFLRFFIFNEFFLLFDQSFIYFKFLLMR